MVFPGPMGSNNLTLCAAVKDSCEAQIDDNVSNQLLTIQFNIDATYLKKSLYYNTKC